MSEMEAAAMSEPPEVFVVIDIGCHECGVSSQPVGIYRNEVDADTAAAQVNAHTAGWRDGGQSIAQVFRMKGPRP